MREKIFIFFIILSMLFGAADAARTRGISSTNRSTGKMSEYIDPNSYGYMYPYMNNQMRTNLNPGTTVSMTNNPMDVVVKTIPMSQPRRVVPRPVIQNTARNATTQAGTSTHNTPIARAATSNLRVVSRPIAGTGTQTVRTATNNTRVRRTATTAQTNTSNRTITPATCLADYTQCMEGYCERPNTNYNRCYCSSRLAQIDSKYQPAIDTLVKKIIQLQEGGTSWDPDEFNEYWMQVIGQYEGENNWQNIDDALNIEWPTPDARTRGQNAFLTGHEYCVQHLRACAYMAPNLRDAYRSQISRDCKTYEDSLIKIKNAAESVIQHYSE